MGTYFDALLLGVIEGLTEFLPVSSTGHLIVAGALLGFEGPAGKVFEIVIQFGAILAICWLYRHKIFSVASGVFARNPADIGFTTALIIGVLPAIIIGVLFHDIIKQYLFSPLTVSIALIVGGFAMLMIERHLPQTTHHTLEDISLKTALKIGFFQALGMIPGVSRAGATIMGALLMGVERKAAAEFSFFLAMPTMLGAASYDLYSNWAHLHASDAVLIGIGLFAAFISALCVVNFMLRIVSRHGFAPFAYYRIGFGSAMLLWLLA